MILLKRMENIKKTLQIKLNNSTNFFRRFKLEIRIELHPSYLFIF